MAIAYINTDEHGTHTYQWYQRNAPEALEGIRRSKINFVTASPADRRIVLDRLGLSGSSLTDIGDEPATGNDPATFTPNPGTDPGDTPINTDTPDADPVGSDTDQILNVQGSSDGPGPRGVGIGVLVFVGGLMWLLSEVLG
jgi:hypothetical protein